MAEEPLISLIFNAPDGLQSRLEFEHEVILTSSAGTTAIITATKPGPTFDPDVARAELSPLIGQVVSTAVAHSNGELELTLESGTILQVRPVIYEVWHFQQPAPGTVSLYHKHHVLLTGSSHGLI
jgi:hypothetical protein